MGENSAIEWCDHTFNPWVGCTKISPACDGCYAESWAKRAGNPELWQGARRRTSAANWRQPLKWDEAAMAAGKRARVFCASLADVFDNQVPAEWREDLFTLIRATKHLDWLLLTKRIGNAFQMMQAANGFHTPNPGCWSPLPNVWLGATVANQEEADRDIPKLIDTPARVRFLSMEPLLGPVDLSRLKRQPSERDRAMPGFADCTGFYLDALDGTQSITTDMHEYASEVSAQKVDWVIVGGESGPGARPMHPDWARSLRDQCAAAGVPFLFKQWGEFLPSHADDDDPCLPDVPESRLYWSDGDAWSPHDGQRGGVDLVARVGKKAAGRLLDGIEHNGFPQVS